MCKKKYQDGGMANTAESMKSIYKNSYGANPNADKVMQSKKRAKKDVMKDMATMNTPAFKDGGKKDMPCNKPKREKKGAKTHVVKGCENGKEKLVRFGHSMPDGTNNPERKKSYCARSKGIKSNSKLKANYWSRKNWKCNN